MPNSSLQRRKLWPPKSGELLWTNQRRAVEQLVTVNKTMKNELNKWGTQIKKKKKWRKWRWIKTKVEESERRGGWKVNGNEISILMDWSSRGELHAAKNTEKTRKTWPISRFQDTFHGLFFLYVYVTFTCSQSGIDSRKNLTIILFLCKNEGPNI